MSVLFGDEYYDRYRKMDSAPLGLEPYENQEKPDTKLGEIWCRMKVGKKGICGTEVRSSTSALNQHIEKQHGVKVLEKKTGKPSTARKNEAIAWYEGVIDTHDDLHSKAKARDDSVAQEELNAFITPVKTNKKTRATNPSVTPSPASSFGGKTVAPKASPLDKYLQGPTGKYLVPRYKSAGKGYKKGDVRWNQVEEIATHQDFGMPCPVCRPRLRPTEKARCKLDVACKAWDIFE